MKKILFIFLLFILSFTNIYGYTDFRHDIKTDYFSSEIFMNKHLVEKNKIDKKIEKIYKKVENYNFDKKVNYLESIKEKILTYLFSNHIKKNNVIYYRFVYYYNQIDSLKYKTANNYKTNNITKLYNTNNNFLNNNNCNYYYNGKKNYLLNKKTRYYRHNNSRIKYHCNKGVIYKDTYSNYYNNYSINNTFISNYNNYNYYDSCNLNIFGNSYTLYSGNYKIVSKEYSNKIKYRRYSCKNGDLKLVSTWSEYIGNNHQFYDNLTNDSCRLNVFGYNSTLKSGDYNTIFKEYSNKIEYRKYKCTDGNLNLIKTWYQNIYNSGNNTNNTTKNNDCIINALGQISTLNSGNYSIIFKEYSTKIEYRKYRCTNGNLRLVKTWYHDTYDSGNNNNNTGNKCTLNLDGNYYTIYNGKTKYMTKFYYLNGIKKSYIVRYYCSNGKIEIK